MSKCKGRNSPTTNKCLHGWSLAKKPHKRLTFVPHIRNVKTLVQISLLTSCSLTHPSSQTSFPRQDLKTSIVLEFIKVLDGSFRCFLSDLTESVEANGPACGSALIKKGVQVQLQLAASATLISGTHTHTGREGGGVRPERVVNKLEVSEHVFPSFPKPFLLPLLVKEPCYSSSHTLLQLFSDLACCRSAVMGQRQTVDGAVRLCSLSLSLEFTQATPACKISLTCTVHLFSRNSSQTSIRA